VLKIDAADLPAFSLTRAVEADAGARVLALSNLFGVATGSEAASVQRGTISIRTQLDARRGAYETPYHGPIYVLDVVTNNPGAAGGALVTQHGELLGMLGKELRNAMNNSWLNYAIPIAQLRGPVEEIRAGKFVASDDSPADKKPQRPISLAMLGLDLVPEVVAHTPPYVDHVAPDSPAARAGVRTDDLVLLVGDHLVQSCHALRTELERIDFEDPLHLTVLRGQEMLEFTLRSAAARGTP
jgi:serine protease Do